MWNLLGFLKIWFFFYPYFISKKRRTTYWLTQPYSYQKSRSLNLSQLWGNFRWWQAWKLPWELVEKRGIQVKQMKACKDQHNLPSHSVQFSSVTLSCPTLCDPMDCSTPGLPVHHQCLELAQIHVHWVGDAIQPSHPLSSPSPPTFSLSQHQGLFQWVSSSNQIAKVLEFQLQHQSFQWIFRTDFL